MKRSLSFCVAVSFALLSFAACSGLPGGGGFGGGSGGGGGGGGGGVTPPLFIMAVKDAPPAGVTVLSFQTGALGYALIPQTNPGGAVNINAGRSPVDQDFTRLQSDSAIGAIINVNADTYSDIQVSQTATSLVIFNQSGAAIGSCADQTICNLNSDSSALIHVTGVAFPLGLSNNGVFGIALDYNLSKAITVSGGVLKVDFTQPGALTAIKLPLPNETKGLLTFEDVVGIIGSIDTAGSTFTATSFTQGSIKATIDGNTVFHNFSSPACATPGIVCLKQNQVVSVDYGVSITGTVVAREINLEDDIAADAVEGIVTNVDDLTHFRMVVLDKVNFSGNGFASKAAAGEVVEVAIAPSPTFLVDVKGLPVPTTPVQAFLAGTDTSVITPGQDIQVNFLSTGTGINGAGETISADKIRLRFTRATGTVSGSTTTVFFNIASLPGVFAQVNPLQVQTFAGATQFEGVGITDATGLKDADVVSIRALYFKNQVPSFFAAKVRKH